MTQIDPLPPPADDQLVDLRRDNPDPTPIVRVSIPFSTIARWWHNLVNR